ncbi:hypothetical protein C2E21_5821 [Chlorella sorokiniana]|uniref:Uncharacterized protein n=1 Tax=Chlorella sorokiniana TaxID=3076 RepID=A0A2P6TM34_CHLSO|nr:hypothetical protein C2E21_5821 [Chlorella sorokiniana]|eukprot:PRW45393.1 hypothetical protein C2E21_5821 [Chlorella sorokiniana]
MSVAHTLPELVLRPLASAPADNGAPHRRSEDLQSNEPQEDAALAEELYSEISGGGSVAAGSRGSSLNSPGSARLGSFAVAAAAAMAAAATEPAVPGPAAAAVTPASAAEATAALLCERGAMGPATDALASLFPNAASFSLGCPSEHGGSQVALLVREALPAACSVQAPAALCSVHGGWCQLATAAPASEDERLLLNSYATELEWQLNEMLKEMEEEVYGCISAEHWSGGHSGRRSLENL